MIEIHNIKLSVAHTKEQLEQQICKKLHRKQIPQYQILKRSIDARKKPDSIFFVYTIGVEGLSDQECKKAVNNKDVMYTNVVSYTNPISGSVPMKERPYVIGAGPAGLFCALELAKQGYAPIVVERGACVEDRIQDVNTFWETGKLNIESNVQFGEGGAGTFSDGKLNTQVKDKYGRIRYVLETFVKHGAPLDILYDNKPHVGTDLLVDVVKGIREEIKAFGGTFFFHTKMTDFKVKNNKISEICLEKQGDATWYPCSIVVFALGHSARDTFQMLHHNKISMEAKDFAMGVRIEHPAKWIQKAMYGEGEMADLLPAAPYKLTHQTQSGRGIYTFCMCPGGYIVNASSEEGMTAVNGMSYSGRNGKNSNAALIVTVKKSDFESEHPLAGIEFQRKLERNVYKMGNGKVVSQRFEDFLNHKPTQNLGNVVPQIKGGYQLGDVRSCLPEFMGDAICEGIFAFDKKITGYADADAMITGVESRTSSPLRIHRDIDFEANVQGIYPCGEGAGYAGGIMSAAMDGMKVAEAIIQKYMPCDMQ